MDLPLNSYVYDIKRIILIGHAFDPFNPQYDEKEILKSLIGKFTDLESLINATSHLAGRWIIIFQKHEEFYLYTDPCGFRQVFYAFEGNQIWCASQPELINANMRLFLDPDVTLKQFILSNEFAREESAWIGFRTLYKGCFHLLPNHYLKLKTFDQIRFFPVKMATIKEKKEDETLEFVAYLLKGIMAAISSRNKIVMALSSGWDSRVLLAATKSISSNIEYFADRKGIITDKHPDIWVPNKMSQKLKIKFTIRNSNYDLPGWFINLLSKNVTGARILPKTKMIFAKLINNDERMYINGNGGEICRIEAYKKLFEKRSDSINNDYSSDELVCLLGYKNTPAYALNEINQWRNDIELNHIKGISIVDLLYWEQRLGNWGSLFPAEQDIAVEEISPFNCRLLIETLMSCPREKRSAPEYPIYKKLIKIMWPEVLEYPINPKSKFYPVYKLEAIYKSISSKFNYSN